MSAKAGFPTALVVTILGLSPALGQTPYAATPTTEKMGTVLDASTGPASAGHPMPRSLVPAPDNVGDVFPNPLLGSPAVQQSSWMQYTRPDCCGPVGGRGPVQIELYARTGPSLVIGGGIFNQILNDGWEVQGGGRSLFFNSEMSGAWTVDLGLAYFYNHAQAMNNVPLRPNGTPPNSTLPITFSHFQRLNRTNVTVALGREWFYTYHTDDWTVGWRFGFDVGGAMGTIRADFVDHPHRTDILYGLTAALHSDIEIPRGCCTFVTGARVEFEHDWMDVLQTQNNSNIANLNILWTIGVRY